MQAGARSRAWCFCGGFPDSPTKSRKKLDRVRPETLARAARIDGMTPRRSRCSLRTSRRLPPGESGRVSARAGDRGSSPRGRTASRLSDGCRLALHARAVATVNPRLHLTSIADPADRRTPHRRIAAGAAQIDDRAAGNSGRSRQRERVLPEYRSRWRGPG